MKARSKAQRLGVEPLKAHNGGLSTDGCDPELVAQLARRIIRPMRERARLLGYAITVHGSLAHDIDLVAVPWTDKACPPEGLANSLRQVVSRLYPIEGEVTPSADPARRKPHGRLCWAWWIRPWTYIDLSAFPPTDGDVEGLVEEASRGGVSGVRSAAAIFQSTPEPCVPRSEIMCPATPDHYRY